MTRGNHPFSSEELLAALQNLPSAPSYWVGFSGGADSTALLYALHELADTIDADVIALHVNHGLNAAANEWQAHCQEICAQLNIALECRSIRIKGDSGAGIEAEARHLRYELVEQLLGAGDVFLTAHHRDDQAETLLLNLMRGSGVDGLAGMPVTRRLGKGLIARPLLDYSMVSLRDYLVHNDITWLEDPSNLDLAYDRNYVRHELIPVLENRWPGASEGLARSARHCREASTTLAKWAEQVLEDMLDHPRVLNISGPRQSNGRLAFLLRHWLRSNGAPPMPERVLSELRSQASLASKEHHVRIEWNHWVIHLYRGRLWLQECATINACPKLDWTTHGPLQMGYGIGTLTFESAENAFPEQLRVDTRRGGERIHPCGAKGHKGVKDILREAGFPPWMRPSVPLLFCQDELMAVGDFFISEELSGWLKKQRARLSWKPSDAVLKFAHTQQVKTVVDGL